MFKAGIYCRVSIKELNKGEKYSNSIHSQLQIAEEYIATQQDILLSKTYIDDGVSGSNFDRPEFHRMLTDIELRKINMIIIKDISRLGREHIGTNYYLNKYFPERRIRILSLLDHYDSQINLYDEILDIKTLMNDMYLRDISKKIKSVIRIKRSMGEYTSNEPPYGYVKSELIHNHLEIDPYASEIVKRIYKMYLDGYGCTVIRRILNEEAILCPSRYKREILKTRYSYSTGRGLWSTSSISNILKNPVYTGAIVLEKFERPSYKLSHKKIIPLEERELYENAHEAIISKEQFEQVQNLRAKHKVSYFDNKIPLHKYSGLLFCGKCGYSMNKRYLSSYNNYDGYICSSHQKFGKNYCELNHISFEKLDELVAFTINQQIQLIKHSLKGLEKKTTEKNSLSARQIEILQSKTKKNREYCKKAYERYMDEILTKEEYLELKSIYDTENKNYQTELKTLEQELQKEKKTILEALQWLKIFSNKKVSTKQLTRELLSELIKRIDIYPDRQIDIQFHFNNPLIKK